ncbi:MAG: hypothetical protein Q7R41_08495 [Phycisphaerales bacterium]|nr:hypothetical protein [Phycisphaerales bacterium]
MLRMTPMGIFRHANLSSNEVKEWDAPLSRWVVVLVVWTVPTGVFTLPADSSRRKILRVRVAR